MTEKRVLFVKLRELLVSKFGRLSFRERLVLMTTFEYLQMKIEDLEKENKRLRERIEFSDFRG